MPKLVGSHHCYNSEKFHALQRYPLPRYQCSTVPVLWRMRTSCGPHERLRRGWPSCFFSSPRRSMWIILFFSRMTTSEERGSNISDPTRCQSVLMMPCSIRHEYVANIWTACVRHLDAKVLHHLAAQASSRGNSPQFTQQTRSGKRLIRSGKRLINPEC